MNNKKFKRLVLALKLCLILAISVSLLDGVDGFISGWNYVHADFSKDERKLSASKEQIAVIPLRDSLLYVGQDYSITGINSFRIQERTDVSHTSIYYFIVVIKLILGITALVFLIKFLRRSFALLNQFEKFIIIEKSNLLLLNKAAYNLLITGLSMNLLILISNLYNITWFHINGYRIDFFYDFDLGFILTALILLILSWVIKYAIELKEEIDLTV
jgi:hypothetical protein